MTEPKKYTDESLAEWRKRNMSEIDECLRTWIEIRDDREASARDRNEAAKNIARALSALAPDRVTEKAPTRAEIEAQRADLDPKHKRELDDILARGI